MTHRVHGFCLSVAAGATLVVLSTAPLAAQSGTPQNARPDNAPTPRTPDGHVDFSGVYGGGGGGGGGALPTDERGNITNTLRARSAPSALSTASSNAPLAINFERDSGIGQRSDANKPIYKPEFWDKVQFLDLNGNAEDTAFRCLPQGVPRMGPPQKIVQTPTELIFLYGLRMTRIIPIDGRPLPPEDQWEGLWNGTSVGHWEGDTLVIETVDFNSDTWLGWPGYFHTEDMKVVEKMRRAGNTVTWEATVYDPKVLMKPWTMNSRTMRLNPDPKATLQEDLPCSERDLEHIVTKERG